MARARTLGPARRTKESPSELLESRLRLLAKSPKESDGFAHLPDVAPAESAHRQVKSYGETPEPAQVPVDVVRSEIRDIATAQHVGNPR